MRSIFGLTGRARFARLTTVLNATLAQMLALIARDPRDKRQVVVASPTFITDGRPRANITVFDWFRIRLRIELLRLFELASDFAEIGDVALNGESFWQGRASKYDVHQLRFHTLDA